MAIQITSEERMRLKARARHRLLGAVVLLIATAIILPLLLDQAPRPLNSDVVIDMSETGITPKNTAALPPATTAPSKLLAPPSGRTLQNTLSDNQPKTGKSANGMVAANPVVLVSPPFVPQPKSTEPKATETKSAQVGEKNKSAHSVSNSPSVAAKSVKISQDEKSLPKPLPKPAPKPSLSQKTVDVHTRYVVQLGAFSSAANVRQLCARLKGAGVATYTEVLPSGSTRVRAGPFLSYAQADKTLAKISMVGIQAQIVPLSH
ncbi:MAG: SPOR domain-containing protein [Sulfuriferula sp.]